MELRKLRKTMLVLLVLMGTGSLVQAAQLRGEVLDAEGNPIVGADVRVVELKIHEKSNESGLFKMSLPRGIFTVEVGDKEGRSTYRTLTVRDSLAELQQTFVIDIAGVTLAEKKIEGSMQKPSQKVLRSVEGMAIYEGRKTELIVIDSLTANLASNNARQVFSRVAGINTWESDGAGIQLGVATRGLNPKRTAEFNTRQNGYDMSADALGYPESYYTPPTEALERIEVVRGAASLQYGTQFGGMINFVLRKPPLDHKLQVTSRQTLGTFGLWNSFNSVGGNLEKVRYYAYYNVKIGEDPRPNSEFELHSGHLRLEFPMTTKLTLATDVTMVCCNSAKESLTVRVR